MNPVRRRRPNLTRERNTPGAEAEDQITWLWSTPRSGAELLLQLLAYPLRPDPKATLSFRPPPARASVGPLVLPIDELSFGSHVAPWGGDAVQAGDRWLPATLLNLFEMRDPYLLSRITEPFWRQHLRALGLMRITHARKRATNYVRGIGPDSPIVIKESASTHAADRVSDLMPLSRMIVLVRDPRDVAASRIVHPESFDRSEELEGEERTAEVRRAAELWSMAVDVTSTAIEARDDANSLRLRFEDLLADPASALTDALAMAGAGREPDAIAEAVEMSAVGERPPDRDLTDDDLRTEPGAWREKLTDAEVETIEGIAGERLATLGYEPA
jgi:hypothetical protein